VPAPAHAPSQAKVLRFELESRTSRPPPTDRIEDRAAALSARTLVRAGTNPLCAALLPGQLAFLSSGSGAWPTGAIEPGAFTLLYCTSGTVDVVSAGPACRLSAGALALLPPPRCAGLHPVEPDSWSCYLVQFTGSLAPHYFDLLTQGGRKLVRPFSEGSLVLTAFERILGLFRQGVHERQLVGAAAALHHLLGEIHARSDREPVPPVRTVAERIDRTLRVLRADVSVRLRIDELAALAGMSHSHYLAQFRKRTGESPRRYVNRLKIARACELLVETDAKVQGLAALVGIDDVFYFCRLFKRLRGCTPTEWRRRNHADSPLGTHPTDAAPAPLLAC
jgi:AraC-like DNA-binding protein